MTTCTNPSSGVTIASTRTSTSGPEKDGEAKKALVKFSDAHYWKTESKQISKAVYELRAPGRKTRGIEQKRMRWVSMQPLPIRTD